MNFARDVVEAAPAERLGLVELARDGSRREWGFGEIAACSRRIAAELQHASATCGMNAPASLRALLSGAIDYAGLFPPATLTLEPAVANYADYIRDPDSWMLGAFVLPVGKFDELAANLSRFDVEHHLRISALGAKTEAPAEFISALQSMAETAPDNKMRPRCNAATGSLIDVKRPAGEND